MRFLKVFVLAASFVALAGCSGGAAERSFESTPGGNTTQAEPQAARATGQNVAESINSTPNTSADTSAVPLVKADAAQATQPAVERKIIRNANLIIEIDTPADAQRRIASITESRGGFVVTSEARQHDSGAEGSKNYQTVTIEIRVPAAQFDAVIGEIRNAGGRVREEKITGQDVTEEYIDLEARIRTKKALEEQFLQIMKQARTVSDALEVQTQIAGVRGEIERLEGRRRFLENQTSLSTIKVTLQPQASLVNTNATGFFADIKRAFGDGIDFAAAFILVLIRLVIVLIPVLLFLVLPLMLLARFVLRRLRRRTPHLPDEKPQAAETRV